MSTATPERSGNEWIGPLLERYRKVLSASGAGTTIAQGAAAAAGRSADTTATSLRQQGLEQHFRELLLADALEDKLALNAESPAHPLQLGIIGPTQAGKSSLVNHVLDTARAGVSALAGYTVHAQGHANGCDERELTDLDPVLSPLRRVPLTALDPRRLDQYVLETVDAGPAALVSHAVVWDSPDFDSVAALDYRSAVLAIIAVADALVMMLSKDKYGDQSVWDMLERILPLGKPVLVVINKVPESDRGAVENAFTSRFRERFDDAPALVVMPLIADLTTSPDLPPWPEANAEQLRQAIQALVNDIDRSAQAEAVERFVAARGSAWLSPVRNELAAQQAWETEVDAVLAAMESDYNENYLDDPQKYETFNLALAELLTLLEIPGLASTLARTREFVTWPARRLLGLGRLGAEASLSKLSGGRFEAAAGKPDQEQQMLALAWERGLNRLQGWLIDRQSDTSTNAAWWSGVSSELRTQQKALETAFERESERARKAFEPRIEAAAKGLYQQLQAQPALLNTLRATRVTTDAAGVALAVKSGGLAPSDLVLAPAMLSVTTLLTESALGRYMDRVRNELKVEQRRHIRETLLRGEMREALLAVGAGDARQSFLAGLDQSVIDAAAPERLSA
ncbi:MAG: hypothetical protein CSB44_08355 [Gammaproteobacteria bacterium]|nr:MAG: hypothetical protein CSB44_08355 [Gammaproteobacteria bacterium]